MHEKEEDPCSPERVELLVQAERSRDVKEEYREDRDGAEDVEVSFGKLSSQLRGRYWQRVRAFGGISADMTSRRKRRAGVANTNVTAPCTSNAPESSQPQPTDPRRKLDDRCLRVVERSA